MSKVIYRVLIVEDDESIRAVIRLFLSRGSFKVFEARTGLEGIGLAKSMIPDIIITDLMMPGMSGVDLIKELKMLEKTKSIPIIAMTGGDYALQQKAQEVGATAVVQKPLHRTDLVELITSVLEK